MELLQLKLLGGFAACSSSGAAVHVRGKKNQALLAYLAANADKGLTREKAIGLLWSDRDDHLVQSNALNGEPFLESETLNRDAV